MLTWNIGNTTSRNPHRLRPALALFVEKMGGRPFGKAEQQEFLNELVAAGLVDSDRVREGDDGGRKFASAFKQLGFVTDWSRGKSWTLTDVGERLLEHPEIEEVLFFRQLLKYQIPSPLESGSRVRGFHVRPFRLLLHLLQRAREEGLVGLTKLEIALYVIDILDEDDTVAIEKAIANIKHFRAEYTALVGRRVKDTFARKKLEEVAARVGLLPGSLLDYADSNGRYALMSGLLTTRGSKLALSEARLFVIEAILSDGSTLVPDSDYLTLFYNPDLPALPTDNIAFLEAEVAGLEVQLQDLAKKVGESAALPPPAGNKTLSELQAYEKRLRDRLQEVREIAFYHNQGTPESLAEIESLLHDISERTGSFFGGGEYAPAFLEWAIWRLFLAMNTLVGPISKTRGFPVDEDINPTHHAKGGAADLTFTYDDCKLVCEMTLTNGSRQFAAEGEPVTRHVFKAIEESGDTPVFGLFVAKKIDPNTVDAFYQARYWRNWTTAVDTPIVALEMKHIMALIQRMKTHTVAYTDILELFRHILELQKAHPHGPAWYKAYCQYYDEWVKS